MERTLIVLKPDAVKRGLCGEILSRFEKRNFKFAAMNLMTVSRDLAEKHYAEHAQKPFFGDLVEFITSSPSLALVIEGENAIALSRQMIGATNPLDATPGSIRADLTNDKMLNLVHGSDSSESAQREIALWFPELS